MATIYADAIEIITDDGYGIPISFSGSTTYGLASDGHFYLITGRPGLDGSKTITGDTARTVWYQAIMVADFSGFGISRTADFEEAGCLETVSGLSFGIVNTGGFWSALRANGVYLSRRRVKYYKVTSDDGETFNFELRWTGIVDEQPFTETTFRVECVDVSKEIFQSSPVESVNDSTFEAAPEDSKDKVIPIALGRVARSPLVSVSKPSDKTMLVINDGREFTACGITDYDDTAKTVELYTKGVTFSADDVDLKDFHLTIISGGAAQSILIKGNSATNASTYRTTLTLEEPFEGAPVLWSAPTTGVDVWFAEVQKLSAILVASSKPIHSFVENTFGRPGLVSYDSESKTYEDFSDAAQETSVENIRSTNHPGVAVASKNVDVDGDLSAYFKIAPVGINSLGALGLTWSGPGGATGIGIDQPNLYDVDRDTSYTASGFSGGGLILFEIELPQSLIDTEFDDIYVLVDLKHRDSAAPAPAQIITLRIRSQDIYGQRSATDLASGNLISAAVPASDVDVHSLHGVYFNEQTTPDRFYEVKSLFSLNSFISSVRSSRAFPRFNLQINFSVTGTYSVDIQEIGLIAKRNVNVLSDQTYSTLKGETFGTTWDGRKTATDYPQNPVDAFEKLLRDYDTKAPIWVRNTDYTLGAKIRGTADTGHIFVCTTAGRSHATTEPTWTDTAAATYSDGTAAWKEFMEIPVDKTSFDIASSQRANWYIGRTLTEKKPSEEWYRELCAQAFLIASINASGKVELKAWRENTDALASFDSSNIIEGTLGEKKTTPMRRVYNDLTLRYDENPGSGKFNKQITVTKADQPAFPEPNQTTGHDVDLGTFHCEYIVIGTKYQYVFYTDLPHGLFTGDFVSLTGNTEGFDIPPTAVSVTGASDFRIFLDQLPTSTTSSSGSLFHNYASTVLWKTFVTGIRNYATAAELWEMAHAGYLYTKTISKLPEDLGNCKWFPDPYAKDPGRKYIWSTDRGETPELDVGDDHAAVFLARNFLNWSAWPKEKITFEVIDSSAYSALAIGDCVQFNDDKVTVGGYYLAWIYEKTQLPATDTLPPRFRFGILFQPELVEDPTIIDENGATDIIDENAATNIYDENGA